MKMRDRAKELVTPNSAESPLSRRARFDTDLISHFRPGWRDTVPFDYKSDSTENFIMVREKSDLYRL